jgi:hypothetical protein
MTIPDSKLLCQTSATLSKPKKNVDIIMTAVCLIEIIIFISGGVTVSVGMFK